MMNVTPMVRNLLILNIGLLLFQAMGALGVLPRLLSLYPWTSEYFQPFQHVTYMFLHAGWMHLFSNMFGLFSFGPLLEQRWGAKRFLIFWMVCGIGAGVLYSGIRHYELENMRQDRNEFVQAPTDIKYVDFFDKNLPGARGYEIVARALKEDPTNMEYVRAATHTIDEIFEAATNGPMVGASGALFGILLAFAYLFPNTELMLLFFPVPIKAKYFVFLYGLYELYAGIERNPGDNVAHFAHLGGMLFGFILLKLWEKRRTNFY